MAATNDTLIKDEEVARCYGVNEATVWRWAKAKKIPGPVVQRHKYSRWSANQIQAHIEQMTTAQKKEQVS